MRSRWTCSTARRCVRAERVAYRDFTDLDAATELGQQAVDVLRDGPLVKHDTAPTRKGLAYLLRQAMRRHARTGIPWGEMAVLCHTHEHLDDIAERLTRLDVPLTPLEHWDGRPDPKVKIGTIHRSMGLDFAAVYLPDLDMPPLAAAGRREFAEDTAWEHDRTQREYVARTRPRDRLWIGRLRRPAPGPTAASGSA